jgi:hypothetical protein
VTYQCLEEKNTPSHEILVYLLEGHFRRVLQVFLCKCIHLQTTLAFLKGTTIARIGNQRVKSSNMIEVVYAVHIRNKNACKIWAGKPFKKTPLQMGQQYCYVCPRFHD